LPKGGPKLYTLASTSRNIKLRQARRILVKASSSSSREYTLKLSIWEIRTQQDSDRPTLLSLNRFEEKKNVALAIKAFSKLQTSELLPADQFTKLRLVIGGKCFYGIGG
jgi:glycosyltransferase involved in cell wall biosynthesis